MENSGRKVGEYKSPSWPQTKKNIYPYYLTLF